MAIVNGMASGYFYIAVFETFSLTSKIKRFHVMRKQVIYLKDAFTHQATDLTCENISML